MLKTFTLVDGLIFLTLAAVAGFGLVGISSSEPSVVRLYQDNRCVAEYPLSDTRTVSLDGPAGGLTIAILSNHVHVTESSCPRHVCMQQGAVGVNGQIVCVPNHLVIAVSGREGSRVDVDARTR